LDSIPAKSEKHGDPGFSATGAIKSGKYQGDIDPAIEDRGQSGR
jgi:hypothetical protein